MAEAWACMGDVDIAHQINIGDRMKIQNDLNQGEQMQKEVIVEESTRGEKEWATAHLASETAPNRPSEMHTGM